jgi:Uma2 family endonuclease
VERSAMVVAVAEAKTYTEDEYLALELGSDSRHEYRDGEIVPMAGGTPSHNKINSNLNGMLWFGLKGQPYDLFISDQRLAIPNSTLYAYPDLLVVERPIQLKAGRKDTITNPILIAEVLSDSTRGYDCGDKFAAYRSIPTFQEYLLIDQSQPLVGHYVKQAVNQWLLTEYSGLTAQFKLSSIPVEISFDELYENVKF